MFVVRPFLGGVNGITGESTIGNMNALLRRINKVNRIQDYVVLPSQRWLDGISTTPGKVKQFIAAEMAPPRDEKSKHLGNRESKDEQITSDDKYDQSLADEGQDTWFGASVEWQVTGQDMIGGIQLQIIPPFDVNTMFVGSVKDTCRAERGNDLVSYAPVPKEAREFDVLNTPSTEGLHDGDLVFIKDLKSRLNTRYKTVADLLSESPQPVTAREILELEFQEKIPRVYNIYKFSVSRPRLSASEIFLEVSEDLREGSHFPPSLLLLQIENQAGLS